MAAMDYTDRVGRKELGEGADIMKHLVCVRLLTLFNMLIFTVIS